jgi:hypothetical protein
MFLLFIEVLLLLLLFLRFKLLEFLILLLLLFLHLGQFLLVCLAVSDQLLFELRLTILPPALPQFFELLLLLRQLNLAFLGLVLDV